jgi:flotillin
LINVNIQDVTDESGYIEALGKEASAKAIADAKISVAQAERDSEIGKASADKEMSISVANAQAESTKGKNDAQMQIAQSSSDLRIKQAESARIAQVAENLAKADIDRQTFEAAATAQQARADMQRKQQYAEQIVPAAKQAAVVQAEAEAQRISIAADAEGKRMIVINQAQAVAADAEAKKILALKQAEGSGIKAVLEGRAEGFQRLVASAGGNASEAVVVLIADQLPALVDSQMRAISNLKIDKVVIWGNGENGKSGISSLLKDLMTGLPPVTDLARATGVELPPILGRVQSSLDSLPEKNGNGESVHVA